MGWRESEFTAPLLLPVSTAELKEPQVRGPRGPTMHGSLPRSEADFLMSHVHVHVPNTLLLASCQKGRLPIWVLQRLGIGLGKISPLPAISQIPSSCPPSSSKSTGKLIDAARCQHSWRSKRGSYCQGESCSLVGGASTCSTHPDDPL